MKIWNFGIIGAGLISDNHAKAIQSLENASLIGLCDAGSGRSIDLAEKYKCKSYSDYQHLLDDKDIDIVIIATPSGFHMEPAVAAARVGKHVLCEKPLDISLERIDAMIEAHKKAGTLLGGIFQYRFNDAMVPIRDAIKSGRFGRITCASVYVPWWRDDKYYQNNWRGTWKLDGGGALMNQSIHMIDTLCDLMDSVESVQAFSSALGHDIETEDTTTAIVRYTSGALGMIYGTTASFPGQIRRFELTGTQGTVILAEDSFAVWQFSEENETDEQIRQKFGQVSMAVGVSDPAAISYHNHARNIRAFIESLETGDEFYLDGAEARKAVQLALAIYESAKEGKLVRLKSSIVCTSAAGDTPASQEM